MVLHITSGQNGYATQKMYNVLEGNDNTDNDTVTTITQTAATTANTGTAPHVRPAVNADITSVITQLVANQTAIMSQMAAISFTQALAQHTCQYVTRNTFQVPPIQQVAIRPCSNTFWCVTSTQDMEDVREVEAVDVDGVDGVVTHLPTTCKLQEPCSLCLANSSLKEAQH
jgi:hypothetical protein